MMSFVGCKSGSTPSSVDEKTIVQKVEDAGLKSDDLAHADAAGMQLWFLQHMEVARSVETQCKSEAKDDMTWKSSEDGRICLGAKFANFGEAPAK